MEKIILEKLSEIEQREGVRILYACESGSRAWGFHSPDSDYDVRFIYVHERNWYLGIENRKDFIELPINDELDVVGYDIRKMLKLFRGSNAKIYEWLQSPVVYRKDEYFFDGIHKLMADHYSLRAGIHHYLGLTRNTLELDLQKPQVKLKKYFYALRPVLAAMWIVEKRQCPPMEFGLLREIISGQPVNERIETLLKQKVQVGEGFMMEPDMELNQFIAENFDKCMLAGKSFHKNQTDVEPLNLFFRKIIGV